MITKESFLRDTHGHNCRYSTYMLIGQKITIEGVIDMLNHIDVNQLSYREPLGQAVANGKKVHGKDGYRAVTFTINKEMPTLIYTFTSALECIGYADTDWDQSYFIAAQDGSDFDDFTASWQDEFPYYREDDCWDAYVEVVDNTTGMLFYTGSGACEEDVRDYYEDLVNPH